MCFECNDVQKTQQEYKRKWKALHIVYKKKITFLIIRLYSKPNNSLCLSIVRLIFWYYVVKIVKDLIFTYVLYYISRYNIKVNRVTFLIRIKIMFKFMSFLQVISLTLQNPDSWPNFTQAYSKFLGSKDVWASGNRKPGIFDKWYYFGYRFYNP